MKKMIIIISICFLFLCGCGKKNITKELSEQAIDSILLKATAIKEESSLKIAVTNQAEESKKITTLSVIIKSKTGDVLEEYGIELDLSIDAGSTYKIETTFTSSFDEIDSIEYKIQ